MYSKSASLILVIIVKREGVFIIKIRVSVVSLFSFLSERQLAKRGHLGFNRCFYMLFSSFQCLISGIGSLSNIMCLYNFPYINISSVVPK